MLRFEEKLIGNLSKSEVALVEATNMTNMRAMAFI